jgi:hypothetical protein
MWEQNEVICNVQFILFGLTDEFTNHVFTLSVATVTSARFWLKFCLAKRYKEWVSGINGEQREFMYRSTQPSELRIEQ